MNLSSPIYFLFLGIVFILYYMLAPGRPRRWLLLASSYFFYFEVSRCYILVLLLVTGLTWGGALLLRSAKFEHRSGLLFASIIALTLVPLLAFKYLGPFLQTAGGFLPGLHSLRPDLLALALPIGISFFTFAALGYLIDVYLEVIDPEPDPEKVSLFLAFFPLITAGPIERGTFMSQFDLDNVFSADKALAGARLILIGLTLKIVFAGNIVPVADAVFGEPGKWNSVQNFVGAIDFTFFIYADFAGYSLIAIGSALLLGLRVRPNFQEPFLSATIPEFWRHWHMSLSFWVRDYIFSPLRTVWRSSAQLGMAAALFLSIVTIGVWHGAKWGYLAFGLMHACFIVVSTFTLASRNSFWKRIKFPHSVLHLSRVLITFFLVMLTFVVFRANTISDALTVYGKIFSLGLFQDLAQFFFGASSRAVITPLPGMTYWPWLLIFIIVLGDILVRKKITIEKFPVLLQGTLYGLAIIRILDAWIDAYALTLSSIINFKTFQNQGSQWGHFVKIVLLAFGVPVALTLVLCVYLCWETGELVPDRVAAQRQVADPRLIWFAHHDADVVRFKLIRTSQERPDVLVMGQSRMGGFRSAMFRPYSFYNLSRVSWPLNTFSEVLEHLPKDYSPKVIIFTLDFCMLNPKYDVVHANSAPRFKVPAWEVYLLSLREAFMDLNGNPLVLLQKTALPSLGLDVYFLGQGFRQDGSFVWPTNEEKVAGRNPDLAKQIRWNEDPFAEGNAEMGTEEEFQLEKFARLAKERGIKLIGIQMPLYRPAVAVMEKDPHYRLLADFRAHIADGYFDRLGIIVFDYLNFAPYSADYHYFADPIHPTEPITAAVVLKMAQDPRVRAVLPKLDTNALQAIVDQDRGEKQHVYLP